MAHAFSREAGWDCGNASVHFNFNYEMPAWLVRSGERLGGTVETPQCTCFFVPLARATVRENQSWMNLWICFFLVTCFLLLFLYPDSAPKKMAAPACRAMSMAFPWTCGALYKLTIVIIIIIIIVINVFLVTGVVAHNSLTADHLHSAQLTKGIKHESENTPQHPSTPTPHPHSHYKRSVSFHSNTINFTHPSRSTSKVLFIHTNLTPF